MTGSILTVLIALASLWVCANAVAVVVALVMAWRRRPR